MSRQSGIAGFSPQWMERTHPDDRARIAAVFEDLLTGRCHQHSCEYRVKNAGGEYIWVLCRGCAVPSADGNSHVCAGILTHLEQNNKFDSITGLPSIHKFRQVVGDYTNDPTARCGILLLGLDHFRRLNESANYAYGNRVLKQYAAKLLRLLPENARLFR